MVLENKKQNSLHNERPFVVSPTLLLNLLLIFSVLATSCAEVPPESPVLTLSSTGGLASGGYYPVYTFEIYEDGFVHYHGDFKVNIIGERTAKITPKQVQQLIATYRAIYNFFNKLKALDKYGALRTPSPELFRLQYQDETSEIRPVGFARDMFVNLNKMLPIASWICFDENNLGCPAVKPRERPNIYPIY